MVTKETLSAILATIDSVVWSIAADTYQTLYLNPAAERVYGRPTSAFYADPKLFLNIVHPEDRPRVAKMLSELIEKGSMNIQYRVVRPDGEVRWLEDKTAIARDAEGRLVRFDGVASDITERMVANKTLTGILATIDNIVWSIAADTYQTLYLNPAAERVYGRPASAFYADPKLFLNIVHPEDQPRVANMLSQLVEKGSMTIQYRVIRPDGEVRWLEDMTAIARDLEGQLVRFDGVASDITERKAREAGLAERTAELARTTQSLLEQIAERKAANERIQALSRHLVEVQESERKELSRELHDRVGQNLTALGINLEILKTRRSDDDRAELRARLEDSISLVGSIADAIENVMSELRPPMLDSHGLLPALRWYANEFSQRTGIDAVVSGKEPKQRLAQEIEITLFRIAQEALNNVAKHARATRVELELRHSGGECILSVSDNGIGFDPALSSEAMSRLGRGMVTMRERAQAVGGQLEVKAAPRGGTQILVRVPC